MTQLRRTNSFPPLYYVHSDKDYLNNGESNSFGLAAGYLSARNLTDAERTLWQDTFKTRWKEACEIFAEGLRAIGIDAFSIVPCSRHDVTGPIRDALSASGIKEYPGLLAKTGSTVSFAGKDRDYIARSVALDFSDVDRDGVRNLVVCDDFAESGKTLFGLHAALTSTSRKTKVYLAAVGVSSQLAGS